MKMLDEFVPDLNDWKIEKKVTLRIKT